MATSVTITSKYIPDNTTNSNNTAVGAGSSSSTSSDLTGGEILEKLQSLDAPIILDVTLLGGMNSSQFATPASVAAAVAALVDSSPTALDTLNELANAMGDDPNFATTVTNALANKLSKDGGIMNNTNLVTNLNSDLLDGIESSGFKRRYSQVFTILNTYTKIAYITGSGLSSSISLHINGTSGGIVVDMNALILVNHYKDIYVKSISGAYTLVTLKISSDGNAAYTIEAKLTASSTNPLNVTIFTTNNEDVVFAPTSVTSSDTVLEHICELHSLSISSIDGDGATPARILVNNNVVYNQGNANLSTVDWTAKNINATGLIKAYRYSTATNLPAITMDKQGSYAYGIGPDGTNMRIRYGTAALDGTSWNTTGNAGVEHYFDGKITVTGDIQGDTAFSSGFQGSGARMWKDANSKYNLELDNLTVRGAMNVYELTVQKIKSTNGSLYVSDSGKIKNVEVASSYYIIYPEDINTFIVGDIVKCQVFTGTGVKSYTALVNYVDNSRALFTLGFGTFYQGGTGVNIPCVGDGLIKIGSNTDTNRQGSIYLTNSDTNSPYLQMVDGVTSSNLSGNIKLRLGKLDGITDPTFGALSGYGLYSNSAVLENAQISGNIRANSGNIGKFYIQENTLGNDNIQLYNPNGNEGFVKFRAEQNTSNKKSGLKFESMNFTNRTTTEQGKLEFNYDAPSSMYYLDFNAPNMIIGNVGNTKIVSLAAATQLSLSSNETVAINSSVVYVGAGTALNITAPTNITGNLGVTGTLNVTGTANITRPTTTLTFSETAKWGDFSSIVVNGRREGKTNVIFMSFYSANSSSGTDRILGQITNYISPGYSVMVNVNTPSGLSENATGYIDTNGYIILRIGKGGVTYNAQATWITA